MDRLPLKDRLEKAGISAGKPAPAASGDLHREPKGHPGGPGRLPLRDRMKKAGLSAGVNGPLPLRDADLRKVFEAVDALAGTGYYTWSLRRRPSDRLPQDAPSKMEKGNRIKKLLGSTYAEYAQEFPALFQISENDRGTPEITYDGLLANINDGLYEYVYDFFEERGNGHSPYSLLYELMAAPLFSIAAQKENGEPPAAAKAEQRTSHKEEN